MNKKMKMFIVCAVFILIGACKIHTSYDEQSGGEINHTLYDEQSNGELKLKKIEFSKFTVKIKNKDNNSNWTDLGTLVVEKVEDGIVTGLNNDKQGGGHSSTFFSLKESEVNNFIKAMTKGGSFKTSLYYGYKDEQSSANGIQNKEIITKIESINGAEHIAFLGDKINNGVGGDKTAEYAIPLEVLKKNLK
ncbi:Erp family outer-surface lipoprotein [Borreliella burgdorferi]|uniref:Erp family outer-surface lipoprotein n=1 Tax=Borreliella burgdorferi TaxID=139 RepID=UPI00017F371A|nr:Erp family outer-surface lipoprotein [Borreliella burgdorferi]ACN55380.1 complement regulator-acquiring surface protein 3 [Borreliella burgdorferi WI91-23]ATH10642.1 Erp family outer-surface lipoprotein [Borreliella burgdorferi]MCD2418519.1 Erp family outer-surface lipoprotein [Borreliella burgdorferi]MCD2420921.1 Erp family outer-surface lipoprotein [Borreliella burgdorferi]PRQ93288.1 regulator [Borreliella burgdorferi]